MHWSASTASNGILTWLAADKDDYLEVLMVERRELCGLDALKVNENNIPAHKFPPYS
ncbi:MAG: hypothetical protein WCI51_05695 [Lentisphaerota bacterium]